MLEDIIVLTTNKINQAGKTIEEMIGNPKRFMSRGAPISVNQDGNIYTVEIDLPSFTKDEISVSAKGTFLTVEAQKKEEDFTNGYTERSTSIRRSVNLGGIISEDKITAVLKDGILKVIAPTVPEEDPSIKKIEIVEG